MGPNVKQSAKKFRANEEQVQGSPWVPLESPEHGACYGPSYISSFPAWLFQGFQGNVFLSTCLSWGPDCSLMAFAIFVELCNRSHTPLYDMVSMCEYTCFSVSTYVQVVSMGIFLSYS